MDYYRPLYKDLLRSEWPRFKAFLAEIGYRGGIKDVPWDSFVAYLWRRPEFLDRWGPLDLSSHASIAAFLRRMGEWGLQKFLATGCAWLYNSIDYDKLPVEWHWAPLEPGLINSANNGLWSAYLKWIRQNNFFSSHFSHGMEIPRLFEQYPWLWKDNGWDRDILSRIKKLGDPAWPPARIHEIYLLTMFMNFGTQRGHYEAFLNRLEAVLAAFPENLPTRLPVWVETDFIADAVLPAQLPAQYWTWPRLRREPQSPTPWPPVGQYHRRSPNYQFSPPEPLLAAPLFPTDLDEPLPLCNGVLRGLYAVARVRMQEMANKFRVWLDSMQPTDPYEFLEIVRHLRAMKEAFDIYFDTRGPSSYHWNSYMPAERRYAWSRFGKGGLAWEYDPAFSLTQLRPHLQALQPDGDFPPGSQAALEKIAPVEEIPHEYLAQPAVPPQMTVAVVLGWLNLEILAMYLRCINSAPRITFGGAGADPLQARQRYDARIWKVIFHFQEVGEIPLYWRSTLLDANPEQQHAIRERYPEFYRAHFGDFVFNKPILQIGKPGTKIVPKNPKTSKTGNKIDIYDPDLYFLK